MGGNSRESPKEEDYGEEEEQDNQGDARKILPESSEDHDQPIDEDEDDDEENEEDLNEEENLEGDVEFKAHMEEAALLDKQEEEEEERRLRAEGEGEGFRDELSESSSDASEIDQIEVGRPQANFGGQRLL